MDAEADKKPRYKLNQAEKDAIDIGLQSIKEGRFKSHEEVMEITRKKFKHLIK